MRLILVIRSAALGSDSEHDRRIKRTPPAAVVSRVAKEPEQRAVTCCVITTQMCFKSTAQAFGYFHLESAAKKLIKENA